MFCDNLFLPTTFILGFYAAGQISFDKTRAFSLLFSGNDNGAKVYRLDVPAAVGSPPPPPTLTVLATGCTTCCPGSVIGFVARTDNAGSPMLVEFKTGARLPDGTILSLLGRHVEEVLPTGVNDIPIIPNFALSAPLPTLDVIIEAALLEPELGVTISRNSMTVHILP